MAAAVKKGDQIRVPHAIGVWLVDEVLPNGTAKLKGRPGSIIWEHASLLELVPDDERVTLTSFMSASERTRTGTWE